MLVSHDQHADNLDEPGRRLLERAEVTLTTRKGARRLGGNAIGLDPWDSHTLTHASGSRLKITAAFSSDTVREIVRPSREHLGPTWHYRA